MDFVEEDEEPAPSGNLLITEVMYDLATSTPAQGTETANEWIELYNGTDQTLDLTGYTITDAASSDTLPDGTLLEAGQFLLITSSSTTEGFYDIPEDAVIVVLTGAIGNGLGNASDFLELRNDEGSAVDAVSWGDNTSAFSPAVPGVPTNVGYSIGRIDIDVDTGTAADWETKEDPSPGQE